MECSNHTENCVYNLLLDCFYRVLGISSQGASNQDLIDAAGKGDLETVKRLLANGADVNAKDNDGKTALMVASWEATLRW